jgi:trk system potassium uptake protein TrkH
MNVLLNIEILGALLFGLGVLECVPMAAAWAYHEPVGPYLVSAVPALAFGLPLAISLRAPNRRMRTRDGIFVVSTAWFLVSAFGALPYVLTGVLAPVDALFESVSGFTTTGSTVMREIESSPHGLLLWRALTQWLGGMGIIVLTIAILPYLGIGGMQLFRVEAPGPVKSKLSPRIADTARRLWFVYCGFTVSAFASLWAAGLGKFDALCHALSTIATGGFSTRSGSIGAFESPLVEWIVILFMLAAGANFVLHYKALTGRFREVVRDEELRVYLAIAAGITAMVTWVLWDPGFSSDSIRTAAFQVVSLMTTTGFGTSDYELWPQAGQILMLLLLVLGGMAGSTAGGLKTMRLMIGWRALRRSLALVPHRNAIRAVHFAGRSVPESVVSNVLVFFVAYFALAALAALVVASAGYDMDTSVSAALTAMGNVGPGVGAIGPMDHFAHLPAYVKLALAFCMIAGRLEVITLLALLNPQFWRR